MSRSRMLVPEAKQGLSAFKNEVAAEMGVPFSDYNGNLTSRQCGSVGGSPYYVFDYAASRYEDETMVEFQNLYKRVVDAIVNDDNADGCSFKELKEHVCGKKNLLQKIKDIFSKK